MTAQVRIAGELQSTSGYNLLEIVVMRNNLPYQTISLPVTAGTNLAFDQYVSITA